MENYLNHRTDLLTPSSVSSCTEHLNHRCQPQCNCCECGGQCYFINLHTYTILKKLCRKTVKDFNRAQCREKYKVFDGGNSVNIRVHRPGSRGDSYCDLNGDDGTNRYRDKKYLDGRGRGEGDSQYYDKRWNDKRGRDMSGRDMSGRDMSGRDKSGRDKSGRDKDRESKKKGGRDRKKDGTIDDVDGKRRKHKGKRDQDDSSDKDGESKKKGGKKGSRKHDGGMDDSDDPDSKKKSGRDRKKGKRGKNGEFDDDDDKDGSRSKGGRRGRKSKTGKGGDDDSTGGKRSKSKGSRYGKGKDGGSLENGRGSASRSKKGSLLDEQTRKLKPSRADEVKACDYLRALMEHKEMCKLICSTKCNPCNPCVPCAPCVPCSGVSYNPCACTYPKAQPCIPYPSYWQK